MADDDGRPTMSEALEALRGGHVEEPAPDVSLPGSPSLRDVFGALSSGADPDQLMASLKAARMPSVPLGNLADAVTASAGQHWCRTCQRPEPDGSACPEASLSEASEANLPADPFTPGRQAGIAAMDMYDDLLAAGMPLASVERVLGAMFASLIHQAEGTAGE